MRGRGSDQGGRWPVGIWFALVGVSAGTVASFAMLGWTFARGLYTGADGDEPYEIESGTVVIEGEEPAVDPGGLDGAPGDPAPGGLAGPGAGVDPEAAKPQVEPLPEPEPEPAAEPGPPVEEAPEESAEATEPPRLVPVEEEEEELPCPEESGDDPGHGGGDWEWDRGRWGDHHGPDLEIDLDLQAPEHLRPHHRD
ncbi:hypothetical protein GCM10009830_49610 [Glycomyces endophyticus]|uniref:Uncharacterized protein n=1 Tax=Glycomyces endophyticus TaxID=480996 RepID=A0ABN2HYR8_9ACTN